MAETTKDLETAALQLPTEAHAKLVECLIASLDPVTDANTENLWLAEVERRLDEVERGGATTFPAHDVLAEARTKLR